MTMLRQLVVATTHEGYIGTDDGKLLFSNAYDMMNFRNVTLDTVLIVGSRTAQSMMDYGIRLNLRRPMIVVGSTQLNKPEGAFAHWRKNLEVTFYADSLDSAFDIAEELVEDMNLNGWTLAGGAQLYRSFLDGYQKVHLNSAYIMSVDLEVSGENLIRVADSDLKFEQAVKEAMQSCDATRQSRQTTLEMDGKEVRTNATFIWLYDPYELFPKHIHHCGSALRLETLAGELTLRKDDISSYLRCRNRNAVQIFTKNGVVHDIRFDEQPESSVNSLIHTLNSITKW